MKTLQKTILFAVCLVCSFNDCIFKEEPEPEESPYQRIVDFTELKGKWVLVKFFRETVAQGNQSFSYDSSYSVSDSAEVITFVSPDSNILKVNADSTLFEYFSVLAETSSVSSNVNFTFVFPYYVTIWSGSRFGPDGRYIDVDLNRNGDLLRIISSSCLGSSCTTYRSYFKKIIEF